MGPTGGPDFEAQAARLGDANLDIKIRSSLAIELRDSVDSFRDGEGGRFCQIMLPVILSVLQNGTPVFKSQLPEQQMRHALLETIHRLPQNEAVKPFVSAIMSLVLHLLRTDNEENGVICVKIVIDLCRHHKAATEQNIASFVDFVVDLYTNSERVMNETFDESKPQQPPAPSGDPPPSQQSIQSVKVLIECPIAVVFVYQQHKPILDDAMKKAMPIALHYLELEAAPQKRARDEAKARDQTWTGVAPGIHKKALFTDFITSQVKTLSLLAYVHRTVESLIQFGDKIAASCVRILQDCPPEAAIPRKELLGGIRHILGAQPVPQGQPAKPSEFFKPFVPYIELLLDERVIIGSGVACHEVIRPIAFGIVADLIHHVRADLTPTQLSRALAFYSVNLHNPNLSIAIQTMCAKIMTNLVETIQVKYDAAEAAQILNDMLDATVAKLRALHTLHAEVLAMQNPADGNEPVTMLSVEKARPIPSASFVFDNPDDVLKDIRTFVRTLIYGFRAFLLGIRACNGPEPSSELIGRLFEGGVLCIALFKDRAPPAEEKDVLDRFAHIFSELEPHVFQEVWTLKMDFFFETMVGYVNILNIVSLLYSNEPTSPSLLSIFLRFLSGKLDTLGDDETIRAAVTIRVFKTTFSAVGIFPEANEKTLCPHLGRIIMDSFPLAAKAKSPSHYYLLLRALFRAIGGGAGRFEQLYKEVLPLLPEMLENLNRLLLAAEPAERDMLVELCLTVPVRLTHLLPYLGYLMQPLVMALNGGPELIAQGLRTLELCVDNLTQEFLDPTLSPVLRELMTALHNQLKPGPLHHVHAHTTVRILGKLGGRNRRLQHQHPLLEYRPYADPATILLSFVPGRKDAVDISSLCVLAAQSLRHSDATYRSSAFDVLRHAMNVFVDQGADGHEKESVFKTTLEGLIDAVHMEDFRETANQYMRTLAKHMFSTELTRDSPPLLRRYPTTQLITLFLDVIPHALASADPAEAASGRTLVADIVRDLVEGSVTESAGEGKTKDPTLILHQMASRFTAMCFEEAWRRKVAGCSGIVILTSTVNLGEKFTNDRELDFVRALLSVLKDMPSDPPRNVGVVVDALTHILRICNRPAHPVEQVDANGDIAMATEAPPPLRPKVPYLIGIMITELASANPMVRKATQSCIELLAELSKRSVTDLLTPSRDRLLNPLFNKPLRALQFATQIGNIEAVTYCLNLEPPLPDLNEELLRLLHEALGLADADDQALIGRSLQRQNAVHLVNLRVACIRLLTASMHLTDFFSKQPQTRTRVTAVYFKLLYANSQEVKQAAHDGLRIVLGHQNRLPKDLLQSGLRPILLNLADPKRLSVPGLEGLARLLQLLTNYFKVEIGVKLLDHFRIIADPVMLRDSAFRPLAQNEEITKLVRLVNIFHLLPPAANGFLEDLVGLVVQTETELRADSPSPFTEALGKFLDRYPVDALESFLKNLHLPRHVRTLRNILSVDTAPNLTKEFIMQTDQFVKVALRDESKALLLPGLQICTELVAQSPKWLEEQPIVLEALQDVWRGEFMQAPDAFARTTGDLVQIATLIASLFMHALEHNPRVDLLLDLVAVYNHKIPIDLSEISRFLFKQVALSESVTFRRQVLIRFIGWFDESTYSWQHKTAFLRLIINPMLIVSFMRPTPGESVVEADFISMVFDAVWHPKETHPDWDDFLRVELLHMSSILVQYCPSLIEKVKRDVIKFAWNHIADEDATVKQTTYILAARFFQQFDSPPKFIRTLWAGLLRPPPFHEGRSLIKQALDILAPALPIRLRPEHGSPSWEHLTRRILIEEGHNISQLVVIYQLIIRHADLFYPCRELFVPHMVNALTKLGLMSVQNLETRMLSLDVLALLLKWEKPKVESTDTDVVMADAPSVAPQTPKPSTPATGSQSSPDGPRSPHRTPHERPVSNWVMPLQLRETIVSYLVRFVVGAQEIPNHPMSLARPLALLKAVLGPDGWSEVTVKLQFFIRTLELDLTPTTITPISQAAKVLAVVASTKDDKWFLENAPTLLRLIQKGIVSNEQSLHDSFLPTFNRIMQVLPHPVDEDDLKDDALQFYTFVNNAIQDGLARGHSVQGTLRMLHAYVKVRPSKLEVFAPGLNKIFTKVAKEHVTPGHEGFDVSTKILTLILEISRTGVGYFGDARKQFLQTLVSLVEKSTSIPLCRFMLDLARDWVLERKEGHPTLKEKASLLMKMLSTFEPKNDDLFGAFLSLIFDIYTEPSLVRTDLTVRLEPAFLVGCRSKDPVIRTKFIELLDTSIPRPLSPRLTYVLGTQSWEALAECHWIYLALDLILGSVNGDEELAPALKGASPSPSLVRDILLPMRRLLFLDPATAHRTWLSIFPAIWAGLSRKEQNDLTHNMIVLLTKDHHNRQIDMRPNVIQTLLEGINACSPPMSLPPHVVKFLGKTFCAWHVALEMLQNSLTFIRDEENFKDSIQDALAQLYSELAEDDMFYGLWRRRALYTETVAGLSLEQNGLWVEAQPMYEAAQTKARTGVFPYSESEYCLWEDHWILAAQKLQQWDVLSELGKSENNPDLILECMWRLSSDWTSDRAAVETNLKAVHDIATPRRLIFAAFTTLTQMTNPAERNPEFTRLLEEGTQLALRKWAALPSSVSMAHVPLLQHFQHFVELQEAANIFISLLMTNAQNLEKKSSDLKLVLQAWRERLPNLWDDISLWSDLVSWRQHIFASINKAYLPLIPPNNGAPNQSTFGFRGYHETAWIINRFAHVARKHGLLEVCYNSLHKIYTLPNIEISEAFLKLREQARCHYQSNNELHQGLEVINNTNLMYFSNAQKAEFYTLKGMFIAKLGQPDEANQAFGQAVQMDLTMPKAWAEWGRYNDRMFKEYPTDMSYAGNAVSCYLQAAGLHKSAKTRPLLIRVLWLLSLDDGSATVARAFDTYKGEAAFWYWITLIPQLLASLSAREAKHARFILMNLAKFFPQALFFPLRTVKEEFAVHKKAAAVAAAQRAAQLAAQLPNASVGATAPAASPALNQAPTANGTVKPVLSNESVAKTEDIVMTDGTTSTPAAAQAIVSNTNGVTQPATESGTPSATGTQQPQPQQPPPQPWDHVEDIVSILKTAFPLLALTMETMVDQIGMRFKPSHDEDIFRFTSVLLGEGVVAYANKNTTVDDGSLPAQCSQNAARFAASMPQGPVRTAFEEELVKSNPNLRQYIKVLQRWRDQYELSLESRPRVQSLDGISHWLVEFQHGKFDEIEVPGQYLEYENNNSNFVRISRFSSKFEFCRAYGFCFRRITMHGHDGTKHSFAVQLPAARHGRREERIMQILRIFNSVLNRRKESRKRNLNFHLPAAVPLSPSLRLLQNDSSYTTLQDIYDQHCRQVGMCKEDPILAFGEKIRSIWDPKNAMLTKAEWYNLRFEVMNEISVKMVPQTLITNYMTRSMKTPTDLWLMRKQFGLQLSSASYLTYTMSMTSRMPSRFHLSKSSGLIYMSELMPGFTASGPIFTSIESVPFRLTPNMQHFLTPAGMDGLLTSGIMSIARCLTEPEFDMEQNLSLFLRDEVHLWFQMHQKPSPTGLAFRGHVAQNVESIVKKAEVLACKAEREKAAAVPNQFTGPIIQPIVSLISTATNPQQLAKMPEQFYPWY